MSDVTVHAIFAFTSKVPGLFAGKALTAEIGITERNTLLTFTHKLLHITKLLVLGSATLTMAGQQPASASKNAAPQISDDIADATHLVGLPDVKPLTKGKLKLLPEGVDFTSDEVHAFVFYAEISAVSIGDERTEGGGSTAKALRMIPVMGIGAVAGAATMKQVDLLTIEFFDDRGGYHGVVFSLPFKSAEAIQTKMTAHLGAPRGVSVPHSCATGDSIANSVLIAPMAAEGNQQLPAEYRAILYEHLYQVLRQTDPTRHYIRSGDRDGNPGCTALTLQLTVLGFNKGNQSLRASTGPLGYFIGATSLTFKIKLDDPAGRILMEAKVKTSKRGDSDSLNVANDVAKNISKRVDKALKQPRGRTSGS